MQIVCPHCTTSYAIDPSTLGAAGRTVRCARCKEVWLARADDTVPGRAPVAAMAENGPDEAAGWDTAADGTPVVESPPIASDMPSGADVAMSAFVTAPQRTAAADDDAFAAERAFARKRPLRRIRRMLAPIGRLAAPVRAVFSVPIACAAMGALVLALVIWRVDVVRLLPQTAGFYKLVGLEVNLRGLAIKDVKISSETVDSKPVLVIEGTIIGQARTAMELPRLRFVVRDDHGTEIYGWNTVLEQTSLKPGEKAWFRSRLASPPAEARTIDVRFFNRRDMGRGA